MPVPNRLIGVDFTSTPSRRKPITVAVGMLTAANEVTLDQVLTLPTWEEFELLLNAPEPWLGAFDFPFSLPRELVIQLGWPLNWPGLVKHVSSLSRSVLRETFKAFCDARPVGNKFAHRATDIPAGSSPSMKWVNPPVAYMFHEGAPRLLAAQVIIPGLYEGSTQARSIALEGYPGHVARSITKASYKSDDKAKQTQVRHQARLQIVDALRSGHHVLGIQLKLNSALREQLIDEPGADLLDAAICLIQAAWAASTAAGRADIAIDQPQRYGLPVNMDRLEGWIVGV
jgi:Protein of unknown function (DUF429)